MNDVDALEDVVSWLAPTFSFRHVKARVVDARRETPRARTLVLAPNRLWPGHVAGQHVLVSAEVRGRRVARTFSISSPPRADGLVEITVQSRAGGMLSPWWNDVATPGEVVVLGRPAGDFVLPSPLPPRLAMISAGSGITPLMAMLRELDGRAPDVIVDFEHWAATRADTIFADELESMARRSPSLRLAIHATRDSGRPDAAAFNRLAARCADVPTWTCGPAGFRDAVREAWGRSGRPAPHEESFGIALRPALPGLASGGTEPIRAALSGRTFEAPRGASLLEAAEAAGLRPVHGCRAGICHTCVRRLVSGTVVDLRDGRVIDEPGRSIQLCVSSAVSPVCIDL